VSRLRTTLPSIPPPVTFRRGNDEAIVSCDDDGMILVFGGPMREHRLIASRYPYLEQCIARRKAVLKLKHAEDDV
jgi:hypothetical protein